MGVLGNKKLVITSISFISVLILMILLPIYNINNFQKDIYLENSLESLNSNKFTELNYINSQFIEKQIFPEANFNDYINLESQSNFSPKVELFSNPEDKNDISPTSTVEFDINSRTEKLYIDTDSEFDSILYEFQSTPEFFGLDLTDDTTIGEAIEENSTLHPETVFTPDDRSKVSPATSFPWRTICKLEITAADMSTFIGSAAIIDENHILTAGHCVYIHDHGGWAYSIRVIPGKDGASEPYGSALATYMRTYTGWTDYESYNHDWAVVTLDSNIGSTTGWMGRRTGDSSSSWYTGTLNTAGYPGDLDSGLCMYYDSDSGRTATEYNHWYYMDTYGGQSGSPVWTYDGSNRYITTVHAYANDGSGSNSGTRLNLDKYDQIIEWLDLDANRYPDMTDRGSDYSGFSTTYVRPGYSSFNVWNDVFNMGNGSSRTFKVSYYASINEQISVFDYLIGTDTVYSISPSENDTASWYGIFPSFIPSGDYYIGWIIDEDDDILEDDDNNNVCYISSSQITVDAYSPTNPNSCSQTNGLTDDDTWQNSINAPSFTWNGASDYHSGIEGYYYYWGTNPYGTSYSYTTSNTYSPSPVSDGIYYLRIRAKDNAGNLATTWDTLYVFKYDSIKPSYLSADIPMQGILGTNIPITINTDGSDYIVKITIGNVIVNQNMSYSGGNSYSYNWFISNNIAPASYQVNISITDLAGNTKMYQSTISVVIISPDLLLLIILIITISATIAGGATTFIVYRRRKKRNEFLKGKEEIPSKAYTLKGKEPSTKYQISGQTTVSKQHVPHIDEIVSKTSMIDLDNTKNLEIQRNIAPQSELEDIKNEIITNKVFPEELQEIMPEKKTIPNISETVIQFGSEKEIYQTKSQLEDNNIENKDITINLPKEEQKFDKSEVPTYIKIQDESPSPMIFKPKIEEVNVLDLIHEKDSYDEKIEVALPKQEDIKISENANIKAETDEISLKKLTKEEISNELATNLIPLIQSFKETVIKRVSPTNPAIERLNYWMEYLKAYPISRLTLEDSKALSIDMVIWERILLF